MESVKETINSAAEAVKGTVSGNTQSGTEPASGAQGQGTVNHPYDAGNAAGKWMFMTIESGSNVLIKDNRGVPERL